MLALALSAQFRQRLLWDVSTGLQWLHWLEAAERRDGVDIVKLVRDTVSYTTTCSK